MLQRMQSLYSSYDVRYRLLLLLIELLCVLKELSLAVNGSKEEELAMRGSCGKSYQDEWVIDRLTKLMNIPLSIYIWILMLIQIVLCRKKCRCSFIQRIFLLKSSVNYNGRIEKKASGVSQHKWWQHQFEWNAKFKY